MMDSAPPIRVDDLNPTPGNSRLVLSGRVTIAVAAEFHRAAVALAGRGHNVTVECVAAEYLDTSAMQLLIALGRDLKQGGHSITVAGASSALHEDLRLAGVVVGAGQ